MEQKSNNVRKNSFGKITRMISEIIDKEMDEELKKIGLSVKLFGIIRILLDKEGLTQVEIGEIAGIPGYMTTRKFDELEEMGLIVRKPHPTSRKSYCIYLTENGRKYKKTLPDVIRKVNNHALSTLNKNESDQLFKTLNKVLLNIS